MEDQRCCICFETFDPDTEARHTHFEYLPEKQGEQPPKPEMYFCEDCHPRLRELTDTWTSDSAIDIDCAFCGGESTEGVRISAEVVRQAGEGVSSLMPAYDICSSCDGIFDSFLQGVRSDVLDVPDSYTVYGRSDRHLFGIGTGNDNLYVSPSNKITNSSSTFSQTGVPEEDANCYSVMLIKAIGTVNESPSEIAAFEDPDDAIEFAQLVALFATDRDLGFIESEFEPEPHDDDPWRPASIITDHEPLEVAEKMLGHYFSILEEKLDERAGQPAD